ncbi:MAG TPA: hypothetical protein VGC92_16760, partial [Phenylobacterium sp.]
MRTTLALLAAAGLIAAATPAAATIYTATWKGKVAEIEDFAGVFGEPLRDLAGHDFTAIMRIDTAAPGAMYFADAFSSEGIGTDAGTPLRIALTIDGVTRFYGD